MKSITNLTKKIDRDYLKFISIFLLLIVSYYIFIALKFSAGFIEFISGLTAKKAVFVLNLLDIQTNYYSNLIFTNDFSIRVGFGCEGTEPIALLFSAIIASKSNLKSKLIGIGIGGLILSFWNDLRVIVLFIIGSNNQDLFDIAHNDLFPFLSLLLSIGLYLLWLKQIKKN
jgi:exosortase/archaeosortase family protein